MVTEKEARKMVCPIRHRDETGEAYCLASFCMAWVWDTELSVMLVESGKQPVGFCGFVGGKHEME